MWTLGALDTITGIACEYQGDWGVVVTGTAFTGEDAKVWACLYGDGLDQAANTWSSLYEVTTAESDSGIGFRAPALEFTLSCWRVFFVESYSGSLAYYRLNWATQDVSQNLKQEYWSEPVAFEYTGPEGVAAAMGSSGCWLVAADGVWFGAVPGAAFDASADVLEAAVDLEEGSGSVRLVLDNSHGRYAVGGADAGSIGLGLRLALSFGYVTTAGEEVSAGPAYWVTEIRREWTRGRSVVVVEARDGWLLLESWRARRQMQWASGAKTVFVILQTLAARAGLDASAFSASAAMGGLYPAFTVSPGESGATAIKRLLAKVEDRVRFESGLLETVWPDVGDSSDYEYGPAHGVRSGRYGSRPARWNRARVSGVSVFDEAFDFDGAHEGGERVREVADQGITTTGQASDRADAELRRAQLEAEELRLVVGLNCGAELWDVVTVTDAVAGLVAEDRRVLGLGFRRSRGRYELEMRLGAV